MQIDFGSDTLAAGGKEAPFDFTHDVTRQHEVVGHIRAAGVTVFDRTNARHDIGFSVWTEHASIDAASLFLMTHADGLDNQATLTIKESDGDTIVTLANAFLVKCSIIQRGIATKQTYQFVGGTVAVPVPE